MADSNWSRPSCSVVKPTRGRWTMPISVGPMAVSAPSSETPQSFTRQRRVVVISRASSAISETVATRASPIP